MNGVSVGKVIVCVIKLTGVQLCFAIHEIPLYHLSMCMCVCVCALCIYILVPSLMAFLMAWMTCFERITTEKRKKN